MTVATGVGVSSPGGAAGDAYTRFFDGESRHLLRLAYLLLGDLPDAEDVVQDVLEELYRRWDGLRQDTVLAYARTAVVNRSRSLQRRRAVARRFAARLVQELEAPPAEVEDGWLWGVVQALPRRQREVVVLRYWCDLSEAEIAHVLGISTGTVKSSASRAHARLTAALGDVDSGTLQPREDGQ
jgi:RNA polymerase sigma-70 factor (sigma-E family)